MSVSSDSRPLLQLDKVRFAHKGQPDCITLDGWQLAAGQHHFLYGPSGSGKSTLLSLIAGLRQPQQGQIRLFGQAFSTLAGRKRDKMRARHIGMVFQQFNLVPYLSVLENLQLAAYFVANHAVKQRAAVLCEQLLLPARVLQQRADQLSVGQQQRVAIARALINNPELLIADEPTSALDAEAREQFIQVLLQSLADSHSTLLLVSHDQQLADYLPHSVSLPALQNRETNHVT